MNQECWNNRRMTSRKRYCNMKDSLTDSSNNEAHGKDLDSPPGVHLVFWDKYVIS